MRRKVHYENITNPTSRISHLERRIRNFKKAFTMENYHKTVLILMIISAIGFFYSIIAGIWGFRAFGIDYINLKIIVTCVVIFLISFIPATVILEWEDTDDIFNLEQYDKN